MNPHTLKRLSQIHPLLRQRVEIIITRMAERGITVECVQGLRTAHEQNALYAEGRTAPGQKVTNARAWQSFHNYGIAADLCPFVNGKPDWNASREVWNAIGKEAERLHLEWGGRWKFRDLPHVQMPGLSVSQCFALCGGGSLQPVWDAISRIDRVVFGEIRPVTAPEVEKPLQAPPFSQTASQEPLIASAGNYTITLPVDFSPKPAKVSQQVPQSRAAESVRNGNTLPVLVSAALAARDFLQANYRWVVLAAILTVLIGLAYFEFRPKEKAK